MGFLLLHTIYHTATCWVLHAFCTLTIYACVHCKLHAYTCTCHWDSLPFLPATYAYYTTLTHSSTCTAPACRWVLRSFAFCTTVHTCCSSPHTPHCWVSTTVLFTLPPLWFFGLSHPLPVWFCVPFYTTPDSTFCSPATTMPAFRSLHFAFSQGGLYLGLVHTHTTTTTAILHLPPVYWSLPHYHHRPGFRTHLPTVSSLVYLFPHHLPVPRSTPICLHHVPTFCLHTYLHHHCLPVHTHTWLLLFPSLPASTPTTRSLWILGSCTLQFCTPPVHRFFLPDAVHTCVPTVCPTVYHRHLPIPTTLCLPFYALPSATFCRLFYSYVSYLPGRATCWVSAARLISATGSTCLVRSSTVSFVLLDHHTAAHYHLLPAITVLFVTYRKLISHTPATVLTYTTVSAATYAHLPPCVLRTCVTCQFWFTQHRAFYARYRTAAAATTTFRTFLPRTGARLFCRLPAAFRLPALLLLLRFCCLCSFLSGPRSLYYYATACRTPYLCRHCCWFFFLLPHILLPAAAVPICRWGSCNRAACLSARMVHRALRFTHYLYYALVLLPARTAAIAFACCSLLPAVYAAHARTWFCGLPHGRFYVRGWSPGCCRHAPQLDFASLCVHCAVRHHLPAAAPSRRHAFTLLLPAVWFYWMIHAWFLLPRRMAVLGFSHTTTPAFCRACWFAHLPRLRLVHSPFLSPFHATVLCVCTLLPATAHWLPQFRLHHDADGTPAFIIRHTVRCGSTTCSPHCRNHTYSSALCCRLHTLSCWFTFTAHLLLPRTAWFSGFLPPRFSPAALVYIAVAVYHAAFLPAAGPAPCHTRAVYHLLDRTFFLPRAHMPLPPFYGSRTHATAPTGFYAAARHLPHYYTAIPPLHGCMRCYHYCAFTSSFYCSLPGAVLPACYRLSLRTILPRCYACARYATALPCCATPATIYFLYFSSPRVLLPAACLLYYSAAHVAHFSCRSSMLPDFFRARRHCALFVNTIPRTRIYLPAS